MSTEAIPIYEMVLKSNEKPTDKPKIVRLSENETATVSCRIGDAGYQSGSLSFLKNGKKISSEDGNTLLYKVQNYKSSIGPINFTCSSVRLNGSKQTRLMRVTSRLKREMDEHETLCSVNKCKNDGVCVGNRDKSLDSTEYCICPQNMRGALCEYFDGNKRTEATANPNYLYASIGLLFIAAVVFAILFGRENVFRKKRTKTKKQLQRSLSRTTAQPLFGDTSSLQKYEICDGREDAAYEAQKLAEVLVINEYDNVPIDERVQFKKASKPIIKNSAKYSDSMGITEEIARSTQLLPDHFSNTPRPILANLQPPSLPPQFPPTMAQH